MPEINPLSQFFNDVAQYGCGIEEKHRLLFWTGQSTINQEFWNTINNTANEALTRTDQDGWKLYVGEGVTAWSFVIWDQEQPSPSDWWRPIGTLMAARPRRQRRARPAGDAVPGG